MVFGAENFRNEIVWKRTSAHNTTTRKLGDITDTILFYTKRNNYLFIPPRQSHSQEYVNQFYRFQEPDGRRYRLHLVERNQALGIRPNLIYEYNGYTPKWGWMMERVKLEKLDEEGKLVWSSKGRPSRKIYLDEVQQPVIANLWDDIPPISAQSAERMGYPTQKPVALLERIINASSNQGDVVLDPFCGCGTAIAAAQKLGRNWIGIDITHLAIGLIKRRMEDAFGDSLKYEVIGEPTTIDDARTLAEQDKYQFQWWALGLVGARPADQKKGADHGIDGRLYFHDDNSGKTKQVVLSVKGGQHVNVSHIRDLKGVLEREKAEIGVYICLEEATKPMRAEAAEAGFYHSDTWNRDYPKVQILTIAELLDGKQIDMPPIQQVSQTFKRAKREKAKPADQLELLGK